jgi:hypothetical protein
VAARLLQVVVFPYRGCSFTATTRVQIETKNGFDFADEQARAKAVSAGHTASWKTGSKHVRLCQRNSRDLFSSPVIFVNSKRPKWPCDQKGQREGNYDSDRLQTRTLRYSLRRVSPLDSANWGSHNPKVGGSNPPPATNFFIWFQWVEPISTTGSVTLNTS